MYIYFSKNKGLSRKSSIDTRLKNNPLSELEIEKRNLIEFSSPFSNYENELIERLKEQERLFNTVMIQKRDGRVVEFNPTRIFNSILASWMEHNGVDIELFERYTRSDAYKDLAPLIDSMLLVSILVIERSISCEQYTPVTIDDIQEIVINQLSRNMSTVEIATRYSNYAQERKNEHARARDIENNINRLLAKDESIVHENANKDCRIYPTFRDQVAGTLAKAKGLEMLPPLVAAAHERGDIHFHDLDYSPFTTMTNCCLVDFKTIFENGFEMNGAQIEPPRSITTAAALCSQVLANVSSSQFGGTSINRIDELLAPYAELSYIKHFNRIVENMKDEYNGGVDYEFAERLAWSYTKKEIQDAAQSLEYEVNTLFTSNGQSPFVTFGFGLGEGRYAKEIQRAILNTRIAGLGKDKRTAIFPKLLFTIKKGHNFYPSDPNYDIKQLAIECSTKRMYPDILNYDRIVDITGSFKASMGCRAFLDNWIDPETNLPVEDGRMNLGVVTMNLPRIAIKSKGNRNDFFNRLHEKAKVLKHALKFRIDRCLEANPESAPILFKHGAWGKYDSNPKELFLNKRSTISIGYIGLYEVGVLLSGDKDWQLKASQGDPQALETKDLTIEVLRVLNGYASEWEQEFDVHVAVYGTPSESLTDRFCRLDKAEFGSIRDITDKDYYTNSFHFDVRKQPTPFEKLKFESDYLKWTSGGFINYCEYPVLQQNPKALEAVWDYSYDYVGYLGTNTPIDKCFKCSYEGDFKPTRIGYKCPNCGNADPDSCDVIKRACGYLAQYNIRPTVHGRKCEIDSRKKHMK